MNKKINGKYKTGGEVINGIKNRVKDGKGLKMAELKKDGEGMLYQKARDFFGSWGEALRVAGVSEEEVKKRVNSKKYGTKEEVIHEIKKIHSEGEKLDILSIRKSGYETLYITAMEYFGHWNIAIEESGIAVEWDREKAKNQARVKKRGLLNEIQDRYKQGKGMRVGELDKGNKNGMYIRALRYFGSWEKALEESGIPVNEIEVIVLSRKYKTGESIVKEIQKRYNEGKGTRCTDVKTDGDQTLYIQGRKHFGSWKNAQQSAGVPVGYKGEKK